MEIFRLEELDYLEMFSRKDSDPIFDIWGD